MNRCGSSRTGSAPPLQPRCGFQLKERFATKRQWSPPLCLRRRTTWARPETNPHKMRHSLYSTRSTEGSCMSSTRTALACLTAIGRESLPGTSPLHSARAARTSANGALSDGRHRCLGVRGPRHKQHNLSRGRDWRSGGMVLRRAVQVGTAEIEPRRPTRLRTCGLRGSDPFKKRDRTPSPSLSLHRDGRVGECRSEERCVILQNAFMRICDEPDEGGHSHARACTQVPRCTPVAVLAPACSRLLRAVLPAGTAVQPDRRP